MALFLLVCYNSSAQQGQRYDDEFYRCSFWAPIELEKSYQYEIDTNARYTIFSGGYVSQVDTFYFRADMWRQPALMDAVTDDDDPWLLDSTLAMLSGRIGTAPIYTHYDQHQGWHRVLARYQLLSTGQFVKLHMIRRRDDFFVFTVVATGESHTHQWVNQFLSGYLIE